MRLGIQSEFTKDYLLHKAILVGMGLFSIGKELFSFNSLSEGHDICKTAYSFIKKFMPKEALILKEIDQIIQDNQKIYGGLDEISLFKKFRRNNSSCSQSKFEQNQNGQIKTSYSARILKTAQK